MADECIGHTEFADLDLKYVNDPAGFFESVQLFSATGTALSPKFTQAPSSSSSGSLNGINWQLTRTAGTEGASWPVYLDFWGAGLTSLVTGPFWAELQFRIPTVSYGTNTPEYLRGSLTTRTAVPEPGTMLLVLIGAALVAAAPKKAGSIS